MTTEPPPRIPVFEPLLGEAEHAAVADALTRGAISGRIPGDYIGRFEELVSRQCGARHGVTTSTGTSALALAVAALGIAPGDEVLVPALTNIASAFAVVYAGATPVFLDSEPATGNLDPALVAGKITPRTRAIMPVHLYGHPVDMDSVMAVAAEHGLSVIEDNAEAQGALYRGRPTGGIGHVGCLSFFVNKTITTGEGGMLVTSDEQIAQRARHLKNLGYSGPDKFHHEALAFNYPLTNVQAAIGVAQMTRFDEIVQRKRALASRYRQRLAAIPGLHLPTEQPWAQSTYWMTAIVLGDRMPPRELVRARLSAEGIDTRTFFHPMHQQPVFVKMGLGHDRLPVAEHLGQRGLYLPSGVTLTDADLDRVCAALRKAVDRT